MICAVDRLICLSLESETRSLLPWCRSGRAEVPPNPGGVNPGARGHSWTRSDTTMEGVGLLGGLEAVQGRVFLEALPCIGR